MAYDLNLPEAARRAQRAGQALEQHQYQVAGYLYGIAAECAVKEVACQVPSTRRDEILYAHFPKLRHLILDAAEGRSAEQIRKLVEPSTFLAAWDIKVRYASNAQIDRERVARWKGDCTAAIGLMEST